MQAVVSASTLAGGAALIVGGGFGCRAAGRKAAFEGGVGLAAGFYHGISEKFDESKLEGRPAGSFFTEPKGVRHFGMTKDEGVVLYFVGTDPSTTGNLENEPVEGFKAACEQNVVFAYIRLWL